MAKNRPYNLSFSQAVVEFEYEMRALGRSPNTIRDYNVAYKQFLDVIGDRLLHEIGRQDVVDFMHHLATTPVDPAGIAPRGARIRSKKTRRNYHTALSALWTWAVSEQYAGDHVVRQVQAPKPTKKPIEPFSDEEVVRMVHACTASRPWHNRPLTKSDKMTAERDMAIILCLLDLCLRNSELRNLKMQDVDWNNNRVHVLAGKGDKDRYLDFGNETRKYLRRYLRTRPADVAGRHGDYLFVNIVRYKGRALSSGNLARLIGRIGKRAEVRRAYPHRFRHTGAVRRLQNGMNVFTLKEFMGHESLDTTMRYVHLAQVDLQTVMRRTSPVDNLRL